MVLDSEFNLEIDESPSHIKEQTLQQNYFKRNQNKIFG